MKLLNISKNDKFSVIGPTDGIDGVVVSIKGEEALYTFFFTKEEFKSFADVVMIKSSELIKIDDKKLKDPEDAEEDIQEICKRANEFVDQMNHRNSKSTGYEYLQVCRDPIVYNNSRIKYSTGSNYGEKKSNS